MSTPPEEQVSPLSYRLAPATTRTEARRARTSVAALVALSVAVGVMLGTGPAYAAAPRPAIVNAGTIVPVAGNGLTRATAADAFQARLDGALQRMLDSVLGPGRSTVTTNVELDLDQVTATSTTYARDPAAGALSEQISRRSHAADDGSTRYDTSSASRVNALDELHETRRKAPGDVVKMSVAVLVDDTAAANVDLAQVRELIAVAAGADAGRGDRITVAAVPLHATTPTPGGPVAQPASRHGAALWTALPTIALILLAGGMLLAVRRRRGRAAATDQRDVLRAPLVEQRLPVTAAVATPTAAPPHLDRPDRRHALRSVEPDQAAQQLRGWLGSGG
jgi:flagellar M-ring protein FliF